MIKNGFICSSKDVIETAFIIFVFLLKIAGIKNNEIEFVGQKSNNKYPGLGKYLLGVKITDCHEVGDRNTPEILSQNLLRNDSVPDDLSKRASKHWLMIYAMMEFVESMIGLFVNCRNLLKSSIQSVRGVQFACYSRTTLINLPEPTTKLLG